MATPEADDRTPQRRARDEAIAAEPTLVPPDPPADAQPAPLESHLRRGRKPRVAGLHPGAIISAPDFDAPLSDEFWSDGSWGG